MSTGKQTVSCIVLLGYRFLAKVGEHYLIVNADGLFMEPSDKRLWDYLSHQTAPFVEIGVSIEAIEKIKDIYSSIKRLLIDDTSKWFFSKLPAGLGSLHCLIWAKDGNSIWAYWVNLDGRDFEYALSWDQDEIA